MSEVTGRLERWSVQYGLGKQCVVWGDIYDDVRERWPDGRTIHTSGIDVVEFNEGDIVTTRNSTYLLGKAAVIPDNMSEVLEKIHE